ncbi:helix-hairpin-helix domain-containing protein [Actinospongicola halichondriae]|uniref:helix-hairpin-helix domain-containing protein n=1 Tax=Actinospongicola halichondriae TaxID=3236844 RepID=UPI003D502320
MSQRIRIAVDEVLDATGSGWRAVLGGCLLVGLAVGAMVWLTRQSPEPIDSTLPLVEPASVTTTTVPPGPVVVHVAGAVVAPGVQRLPAGSRVIDAVDAAGGLLPDADAGRVNLAAELADGTQVYVPAVGEAAPPIGAGGTDSSGPIDLNIADATALETLPGVGPATAAAILDHRERNGPFVSVDGLLEVRGIGEAKLAQLRDLVRV